MIAFLTSAPELPDREALNPANGFIDQLRATLPNPCRALYVASSPDNPDKNDFYAAFLRRCFEGSGFRFSAHTILDRRNAADAAALLRDAEMVVLAGGHVPTQNSFFAEIGLKTLLKDFSGVLVGISAGTMNSAEEVYVHPELDGEATDPSFARFRPGLGLTKKQTIPHYHSIKNDVLDGMRVMEDIAYPDSTGRQFYLLTDGSYIRIADGKESVLGEVYLLEDGRLSAFKA